MHMTQVSLRLSCLVLFTSAVTSWLWSEASVDQGEGNFKIAYIAERGNSGRFMTVVNTSGAIDKAFTAPDLPGRYFNGITASRDGKRMVFMRDIEGIDSYSLWRMNSDGTDLKRLTQKGKRGLYPSLSPDGSKLAFTRMNGGVWEIYTMNYDGTGLKRVTDFKAQGKVPRWGMHTSWSPDGGQIVYSASFGRSDDYEIYLMDADGQNPRQLTDNRQHDKFPDFSPDGRYIAFNSTLGSGNRETFVLDMETGKSQGLGNSASIFGLDWSPDGKKIAYCGSNKGRSDIYVMNADGSNQVRLSSSSGLDLSPAWIKLK